MARLFLAALVVASASAGMAPEADKAANYPAGWCDKRFGSPTRTTGECMCKYECEGSGCQRGQGFIWYAYATCKHCKCVAKREEDDAPSSSSSEDDYGDDDPYGGEEYVPYEEPVVDDEEPSLGERLFEFVDENGDKLFAGLFTIVLMCILVPALILTTASGHKADAKPAPKKADDATADKDDDEDEKPRKKTPKCD